MDPSATDVRPEKFEEVKETGPSFHCELSDTEIVRKIAQVLLPGLASACVDNTTGGIFRNPATVAVDMRKEMVDYLTQRSETFLAESVILEGGQEQERSDNPYDIISDFVDDFASSKRNFFSRVSGWVLSDRREDRIDDFVQEMEINGFWFMERREAIAQTLLKNVDFKNAFHCDKKFNTARELAVHWPQCNFRTMDCTNEGCTARFCAAQQENHDSVCPFKILACEQKCSDSIMRREMDKHCLTVCPMKLVNCPFFSVGCQSSIPQCSIAQHRLEDLNSHLLHVLQGFYKDASVDDLQPRVEQLIELSSPEQLAEARDARSLTLAVKNLEAKLEPLQIKPKETPKEKEEHGESPKSTEEHTNSPPKEKKHPSSPTSSEESDGSPHKTKESSESPPKEEQSNESPTKKEEHTESPAKKVEKIESPPSSPESSRPPLATKEFNELPPEEEVSEESSTKEEYTESPTKREEQPNSPASSEESTGSPKKDQFKESPTEEEEHSDSPPKMVEQPESPKSKEESNESSHEKEESVKSDSESEES